MGESFSSLFLMYVRPVAAFGKILDGGRLWVAIALALVVSFAVHLTPMAQINTPNGPPEAPSPPGGAVLLPAVLRWIAADPRGFLLPLGVVAVVFVPAILFVRAVSGFGSFSVLMRDNYLTLLMCALMAWAAAYLPLAVVLMVYHPLGIFFVAASVYFTVLAAVAIQTTLDASISQAIGLAAAGWASGVIGIVLFEVAGPARYFVMSPFLLYYAYVRFGGDLRSLGDTMRGGQNLRRQLEAATNNPRDADAHYQLGLIYQKRRQYSEALARFKKAIEIDPSEADAYLQLGRIALAQDRFQDAIAPLETAAKLNDKLSSSEVWRELGVAYFGVSRFAEAETALAKYIDRRPYDPEGLYWFGKTLAQLGRRDEAKQTFEQCIEAVKTMPSHRRAHVRKWAGMARSELRQV